LRHFPSIPSAGFGAYTCTHHACFSVWRAIEQNEKEKAPEVTHADTKVNLGISRRRQLDFGDGFF